MRVIDRFARSTAWRSTALAGLCCAALAAPAVAQYIPGAAGSGGGGGGGGSPGGSTNAVQYNAGGGNFGGVSLGTGKLLIGQSSGIPAGETIGGDCALTASGAITCLDSNGVPFGALATLGVGSGLASAGGNLANSGVLTFNTRAGAVTLSSSDVTTALGFTPLEPSNNLSDLSSASTARTNLGLGTFATQAYASPPAIGGTTPAAGSFSSLTDTAIAGSTQCVHANSSGVLSGTGSDCGSGGGGGSLDVTDGTHSVTGTTTLTFGNGIVVGGSGGSATANVTMPDATQTANYTIAAADMAGQENFNGASLTATIPAISSTVFANGMSAIIANRNAGALSLSSTPTLNGLASATSLYQYGWADCTSNGVSLDCFGFPGFGALSGDLTASGSGATTLATVNSNVGSFTNANITVNAKGLVTAASNGSGGGGSSAPAAPQGRLTLTSATPVMISDVTAGTTIYYDSYHGNQVPVWNGSAMVGLTITSDEVSMGLSATNHATGGNYDVFAVSASSALALCTVKWTSTTARASAISLKSGVWTITSAPTHCYGGAAGATDLASDIGGANQATLLGTFSTTANGQTQMVMAAAAAAGGGNPCLCLFNAYNQVRVKSRSMDSTATWSYAVNTWQALDAGATGSGLNNRVTWVDGLAQSAVEADFLVVLDNTNSSGAPLAGVDLDSSTATPEFAGIAYQSSSVQAPMSGVWSFNPQLGLHFAQAVQELTNTSSQSWFGTNSGNQVEILQLHLAM